MRLGMVMTGVGAQAAANVGVLRALEERGIEPCCVCGMQAGAWAAALFAMGRKNDLMQEALGQIASAGRRLLLPQSSMRAVLRRGEYAVCSGKRLEHLLLMQTGHRMLFLCERAAVFPCRLSRSGRRIVFSTRPLEAQEEAMAVMHASISFAARAAMTLPPVLVPMEYMGSPLLGETDVAFACRLLEQMGAQRMIVICIQSSPKRKPDALDLAGSFLLSGIQEEAKRAHAGLLQIVLPDTAGAADIQRAALCEQAGYLAAAEQLDSLFDGLGMASCRVLPFDREAMAKRR